MNLKEILFRKQQTPPLTTGEILLISIPLTAWILHWAILIYLLKN